MKIKTKFLLVALILTFNSPIQTATAEGGCPPGQTPTQFGPTMGCAPGGNDHATSQAARPKLAWEDRWGAFAQYEESGEGIVGFSSDQTSKRKAKKAAIEDCKSKGGKKCRVKFIYKNQCASIVAGEKSYHSTSAASLKESIKLGEMRCLESGNKRCKVEYANCTEPVLIEI